jgi:hypothetical protein
MLGVGNAVSCIRCPLQAAKIYSARHVVCTTRLAHVAVSVARLLRELEFQGKTNIRCFDDRIQSIVESLNAHVFSTSRYACACAKAVHPAPILYQGAKRNRTPPPHCPIFPYGFSRTACFVAPAGSCNIW